MSETHKVRLRGGPNGCDVLVELDGRQVSPTSITLSGDANGVMVATLTFPAEVDVEMQADLATAQRTYFDVVRSRTDDPDLLAAVDRAEQTSSRISYRGVRPDVQEAMERALFARAVIDVRVPDDDGTKRKFLEWLKRPWMVWFS